jgi:hypothetical protein
MINKANHILELTLQDAESFFTINEGLKIRNK